MTGPENPFSSTYIPETNSVVTKGGGFLELPDGFLELPSENEEIPGPQAAGQSRASE